MKTTYNILLASMLLLFISSCQKVIDIELDNAEPQIVIEARVSSEAGPYQVVVTRSVGFSEPNIFPAVSGAVVVLYDNLGNTETLTETASGIYTASVIQGTPGRTYTVTVTTGGKTYTAESTMPAQINLDSLVLESSGGFGGSSYYIIPQWQDPAGIANYYRCVEYVNGERVGSFLYDDAFSDGLVNGQPLLNFETELNPGDTVLVEFECIDPETYLYFFSMEQTANNNTAAPANPETNFNNNALGYFSAHSLSRKSVVIPQ